MDLNTIREMILSSRPEHWERWVDDMKSYDGHPHRATFLADVALELRWGRMLKDDYCESWTERFRERHAWVYYVEGFYGGSLVLQQPMVSVNGGHYQLPLPATQRPNPDPEGVRFYVDTKSLVLGRLVHRLSGWRGGDFDKAIGLAGFVVGSTKSPFTR